MTEFSAATELAQELPYKLIHQGKVRDIYKVDDSSLLLVSTDRVSAYNANIGSKIPDRGCILTQLSVFWASTLSSTIGNHLIQDSTLTLPQWARSRSIHVKKLRMLPIEAIVRGYITGSLYENYSKSESNTVYGHDLAEGLLNGSKLPRPIFTPTKKSENDEPLETWDEFVKEVGDENLAKKIKDATMQIYETASEYADRVGIIIADTKLEFGLDEDNKLVLADEVLTPDSSRFWLKEEWAPGGSLNSLDKQFIRNFLTEEGLRGKHGVTLPQEIIDQTLARYRMVYEKITGKVYELSSVS